MQCDLCGAEDRLVLAQIEGSKLRACQKCAAYGKVLGTVAVPAAAPKKAPKASAAPPPSAARETLLLVRPDAGQLIKGARERLGLTQEELAKKLNEKASVLHHIECGRTPPSLDLARKFERALHLSLIEPYTDAPPEPRARGAAGLTIGDLLSEK